MIGQFLAESNGALRIGNREMEWKLMRVLPARLHVQTWQNTFDYHISRWLPLNAKNYQLFQNIEGLVERISFLENILKANILSMLKGLGIHLEQELTVRITKLSDPYILYNKGVGLTAFNADFISNLTIPNNVGIGKNASIGFGVVHLKQKEESETKN